MVKLLKLKLLFLAFTLITATQYAKGAGSQIQESDVKLSPVGPELAPREIGDLLKAYPILTQSNPLAPGGVGVMLWGCDYVVGKAR